MNLFKPALALLCLTTCIVHSISAQITSTNLPILIITSTGAITGTQIQGDMSIIDNISGTNTPTDAPAFVGVIGITQRGGTAGTYPKKSYDVETWVGVSQVSLDTSLLGMPADNDWVLLSSYADRSFARNILAQQIYTEMGYYAPRMRLCEVILNSTYQGVYLFGEMVKRDSNRVDVAKLTNIDISGANLTGGYIIKLDDGVGQDWTSTVAPPYATTGQTSDFFIEYPKSSAILPVQKAYIKSYVDSLDEAMNASNFQDTSFGWRKFAGNSTLQDYMIMNELAKNFNAYRNNMYLHKDKSKKLRVGPIWDMDLAWANTATCTVQTDTGWSYELGQYCGTETELPIFWFKKLSQDTLFMRELSCRYRDLRLTTLDTNHIFHLLDSVATKMTTISGGFTAVNRNFAQWPIWGVPVANEPTPMATNYSQEINNFKTYIKKRLTWLDNKWNWTSLNCPAPLAIQDINQQMNMQIYPNPSNELLNIVLNNNKQATTISLYSMQGTKMRTIETKNEFNTMNISALAKGCYILTIQSASGSISKKIIKE